MARKRLKRQSIGLFDGPDRCDQDDEVAVLGGPSGDSELLGGPSHSSGLFDRPDRPGTGGPGLFDKSAWAAGRGLFDKPAPRHK